VEHITRSPNGKSIDIRSMTPVGNLPAGSIHIIPSTGLIHGQEAWRIMHSTRLS